jgi:outer membrane lipoprotein carrier protein
MFRFEPGDSRRAPVAMFNWQYQEPSEQEVVSDGRTMWVYLPESRQVIESDLTLANRGGSVNPVTFLGGLGNLSRDFFISIGAALRFTTTAERVTGWSKTSALYSSSSLRSADTCGGGRHL